MKFESLAAPRSFWALLLALLLLGGVLRFWNLATVPTDPREVGSAAISARLLQTGDYRHNPLTHGPLLYYLDAAAFAAGGVSIGTARAVPALVGALLPLAFLPFRRYLGGPGVLAAAGLYAVSPAQVAVAHLNTPDTLLMLLDLLVLAAALRFLETGNRRAFLAGALLFGLSATAKEQTFLNALLALAAVALMALLRWEWVAGPLGLRAEWGRTPSLRLEEFVRGLFRFLGRNRAVLLRGFLLALAAFALLYTSFLAFLPGLLLGLFQLVIWATGTISPQFLADFYAPPGYYLPFLARLDLVLALLGLAGGLWAWRRQRRVEVLLFLLGLALLLFFSAIPYKNSKLLVYPLLPWTLAAGSFLAHLFSAPGARVAERERGCVGGLARAAGVRRVAAGAACALVALQSATGLAGLPGLPGVLDTSPDPRYAPLEEMSAILEEATRTHPDTKAFVLSPSEVSVPLVDTSYYLIWGTRHLKEQPVVARVVEMPGQVSLRTVPSGFVLCGLQADAKTRGYRIVSDLPGVAAALQGLQFNRTRPDDAWGFCIRQLFRATGEPVVGTTGNLAALFDSSMRGAGYVRVSMNTTLSGPLVAYIPGRLANESLEIFTRYPDLTVEWLPRSGPSLVPG